MEARFAANLDWSVVSVMALPDAKMTTDSLVNALAQWRTLYANIPVLEISTPFMFEDSDGTRNLGVLITTQMGQ